MRTSIHAGGWSGEVAAKLAGLYYTMLCLAEEAMHGYALMQKVSEISQGTVALGAGTLYTIFSTLEREALIEMVSETERRKTYALTARGQQVLWLQIQRLEIMAENVRRIKRVHFI